MSDIAKARKLGFTSALKQSHDLFPEDSNIYFCTMQGPIHASHCISCPDFSDPSIKPGSRYRRNPSYCTYKAQSEIGRIEEDQLHLKSQELIDQEINGELGLGEWNDTRLVLPLNEADIRSAYLGDIPRWDGLRHGHAFCFRCGPDHTVGVQYRCRSCRDRRLCDNCLIDREEKTREDGSRDITFECPACSVHNTINLGINDKNARYYPDSKRDNNQALARREVFFPLDYHFVHQRYLYALTANEDFQQPGDSNPLSPGCPSPHAVTFTLNDGAVTGKFWIDQKSRLAWIETPDVNLHSLLFTRAPKGFAPVTFTYDLVLSYRTADLEIARDLQQWFRTKGLTVFLMEAGLNQWDEHWPIRFGEAASKARQLAVLATPSFFEGKATEAELEEFRFQSRLRSKLGACAFAEILFIGEDVSVHTALESGERLISKDQAVQRTEASGQETGLLFRLEPIDFTPIDPEHKNCLNCDTSIFFDRDVKDLDDESHLQFTKNRKLALTCSAGHRYCSGCDGLTQGVSGRHTCPKCFNIDRNVVELPIAGRRTPEAVYFSMADTRPVYKTFEPSSPSCLHCEESLENSETSLLCLFGHRFCRNCANTSSITNEPICPICISQDTSRESIGHNLADRVYFFGCKSL